MDFIAGVDGGGTKTKVVCASPEGKVLDTAVFGPFNMNSIGVGRFSALLRELCAYLNGVGHCRALCIGSAGISNKEMTCIVETEMTRGGWENWKLVGDQVSGPERCAVRRSGYCPDCRYRLHLLRKERGGGLCPFRRLGTSDRRRGQRLCSGQGCLAAVAAPGTAGARRRCCPGCWPSQMELDDQKKIISYTYGGDKSRIAALAPLVEQAAGQGDGVALQSPDSRQG